MNRVIALVVSAVACAGLAASSASANNGVGTLKFPIVVLPQAVPAPLGELSGQVIFLNRCVGGCTLRPGMDDASQDMSIVPNQQSTLSEYTGFTGTEWQDIVQCVKEVYSPFNVTVTDTRPASGVYEQIMVAGTPSELQLDPGVGGIGSIAPGCTPNAKGMSFAFTSAIDVFAQEAGGSRVHGMCWIIAQETAHNFGLDHEYSYIDDGMSACNDPMTYRADCGGQKFFRNKFAKVGAFAVCGPGMPGNQCLCGATQNSHQQLLNVFGAGMSLIAPPTTSIAVPAAGGVLGATLAANAGSVRGIARVDFYLNGWKWGSAPGVAFGKTGQPNPSVYQIPVPSNVPNSIYDVQAKAYDDLGLATDSAVVTVTKGAACADASTCLAGQNCEAGKCFWDQPTAALGEECTYNEFCLSNVCAGNSDTKVCTQSCIPGVADSCPAESGLACVATTGSKGICFPTEEAGGCCSVEKGSSRTWLHGALSLGVLGLILGRRRHKRS